MQLECQRLVVTEFHVVDVWLGRELELLFLENLLVGLLDQALERLLTDRVGEPLLDHGRRGLPRAEPRKPNASGVATRRFLLGVTDLFDGHRDLEEAFDAVGLFRGDLDVHVEYGSSTEWDEPLE